VKGEVPPLIWAVAVPVLFPLQSILVKVIHVERVQALESGSELLAFVQRVSKKADIKTGVILNMVLFSGC
jgi:hypothetical protein